MWVRGSKDSLFWSVVMQRTDEVQRSSGALTRLGIIPLIMRECIKRLPKTTARIFRVVRPITVLGIGISEGAMAKVIEFYIPKDFRKPMKWVRELQRGRILEFRPQTRKSA